MKKCFAFLLACWVLVGMTGCSENSSQSGNTVPTTEIQTEATTIKETTVVDTLDADEYSMYIMLCDYSTKLLSPSSLRITSWVKGTVDDDTYFQQIYKSSGDTLEYVIVTAQNKMGGYTDAFAYVSLGSLYRVDNNYESLISYLSTPSLYLKNPIAYSSDSIDKINRALKEYFDSKGY